MTPPGAKSATDLMKNLSEKLRLKVRMVRHADGIRKIRSVFIRPGNVDALTASHFLIALFHGLH